jgi:glycosyltransferase involved in cell wall biosynthesis
VSIIIKALNEERHIAAAVESALAALNGMEGEVILADAASSDRTVGIAARYPIRIVRLKNIEDRSCGAGTQLGFQHSTGEYVCHMDGDMRLHRDFLAAAIRFLEANPRTAGVGGHNVDREISNVEFAQRVKRRDPDRAPGRVTRLSGAGVYRRPAIESVGYLTDRNLHGGEELELAGRLHSVGWTLTRLNRPAVEHYGHRESAFQLLRRRLATRNATASGECFRAAFGRAHFHFMLCHDKVLWLCLLVATWWAAMIAVPLAINGASAALAFVCLLVFPFAVMSLRWRSCRNGIYSVAAWNMFALSFVPGLLRRRVCPKSWIDSVVLKDMHGPLDPAIRRKEPAIEAAERKSRRSDALWDRSGVAGR